MVGENEMKNYKYNNRCLDCNISIMDKSLRCNKCNPRIICSIYTKGKRSANYKDGRTLKNYYCKKCDRKIGIKSGIYSLNLCRKCAGKQHSKRMKGKKNPMFGKKHTKKSKSKMSINHSSLKGKNNGMYGKIAKRIKGNYYNKIYMRSSWEVKFAQFLDLSNYNWQYESKTFDLGDTTYTPDFYIPEWSSYIEIKGWFRPKDKKKFKKFIRLYPKINISLFDKTILIEMGII